MAREIKDEGISLRDWFAGQAMASFLALPSAISEVANKEGIGKITLIAHASYEVADAMLAARDKDGGAS